jgi:hypothetical protein
MAKQRTLKSIQWGETFRVVGSTDSRWHVAKHGALKCGQGYVRITTTSTAREIGQPEHVVNMHGSTPVEVQ